MVSAGWAPEHNMAFLRTYVSAFFEPPNKLPNSLYLNPSDFWICVLFSRSYSGWLVMLHNLTQSSSQCCQKEVMPLSY